MGRSSTPMTRARLGEGGDRWEVGPWIGPANPKYYVLAQYSRPIRSGMTILDGGEGHTVVAYDAGAKKLVIVTANYGTAQWINYDLSKFSAVGGPVSRWITVTGTGDK